MLTKQEYLLLLPFEYVLGFSRTTGLIRQNSCYTKKDFVQRLLRSLKASECRQLHDFYSNGFSYRKAAMCYLRKYPSGNHVSKAFVEYLRETTNDLGRLFFEFPIPQTRVDILRLDSTSHAYEVKSQRDKTKRLHFQLPALRRIFEKVSLVYASNLASKVRKVVDMSVGLYSFSVEDGEIVIEIRRPPVETDAFEPVAQLELLRTDEVRAIYIELFGVEPLRKTKAVMINVIATDIGRYEINKFFVKTIGSRNVVQTRTSMLMTPS